MSSNNAKKEILKNLINIKSIITYIIALMISTVGMGQEVSPFSIAMIGACLSGGIPVIGILIVGLIGNIIGVGAVGALNYILITLMLLILICIKPPKENDEYKNEQIQISGHIFASIILVMLAKLILTQFTVGDMILHITLAIFSVVFYKIFVNSINVIQEITEKRAFSIEEVIGASLMLSVAVSAFGEASILGLSIRNILSIFLVLILGWKNGILIGTTSGVTIGVTLGIIAQNEPIIVATYAISGMIAGVLNKFGKIGVIVGFLLGNGILIYISKGNPINLVIIKEALIASLGLLVVPKWVGIDVEELIKSDVMLPEVSGKRLGQSKEAINQLNMVSETIKDMADTYQENVGTNKTDSEIYLKNRQAFIGELLNNLDGLEENMLYEDMTKSENPIVDELFDNLLEKQEIGKEELLKAFANNNNYIVQYDDEKIAKSINEDVEQIIRAVNYAYKASKSNFIWEEKVKDSKKNIQAQLDGVSKAISNIAVKIEEGIEKNNEFVKSEKKIISALEIKEILVDTIEISKIDNRYFIDVYLKEDSKTSKNADAEQIQKVLEKTLKEQLMTNEAKTKKLSRQGKRIFCYMSEDKFILQIGQTAKTKNDSSVSGDTLLQRRLNDGKYILALSDGMGSGPEARKSSQIAIKMLERLLMSGFDKNTSIDLINTTIMNTSEEIFATLDIAIIDLYNGKIEFIKNGACPTYIKNKKKVQIVKSLSLPAGILKEINLTTYDADIKDQDILIMCSDGIIDSNIEYKNKELWVKYILEDIEATDCQKIADIILNEAIDNNYGIAKDDMSIISCKLIKK
ncbi:MAG: SpoIIE family protein phosphatase [Clostridia bacterium]|nr:SpoIIE family protein phosphatase [Clostridia bacterium]